MSPFAGAVPTPTIANVPGHLVPPTHELLASLPLLALAAVVWALERHRRGSSEVAVSAVRTRQLEALFVGGCGRSLKRLAPEAAGLALCAFLAGVLLLWGGNNGAPLATPEDHALWQQIRAEWPLLTTADSLLGLQSMLRMLLLISALARPLEALDSPLAGEAAALLCLAACARVTLLALSPQDVYHLDGPLGGVMNMALEVAALSPLAFLALGQHIAAAATGRPRPVGAALGAASSILAVAGLTAVAAWAAATNHLAIAGPEAVHLDVLFAFAVLLEVAASAAFLVRAVGMPRAASLHGLQGNAFSTFAHLLLPLQQLLPTYFFLSAFGGAPLEEIPALVGAGRPFEMLQLAGAAQVGAYLLAAVAHFLRSTADEKDVGLLSAEV